MTPVAHQLQQQQQDDRSAGSTLVQEVLATNAIVQVPQPPLPVDQSNGGGGGGGGGSGNSKASPRESGEDSEDESEILEESPCGRWLKRREEVSGTGVFRNQ